MVVRGNSAVVQAPSIVPQLPIGSGRPSLRIANGSGCPAQMSVASASAPRSRRTTQQSVQSAGPGRS